MIDLDHRAGPPARGPARWKRRPALRLTVVAAVSLLAGLPATPPRALGAPVRPACVPAPDVYHLFGGGLCG
ncbi:hypothetical protein ACQP00_16225 [Dactylosporangium sp. CS-047395]|uniref:hypothetical protein n=1 Tax=Dactylosporangium sp. CS-047395 TaxID=3239936 RepID=UPI003D92F624